MSTSQDLLLAIHPEHAASILSGRKTFEVRARFPSLPPGTRVYLYATSPVSAVVGGFEAGMVVEATAESIWGQLSDQLGITKEGFEKYARGRKSLKAIEVLNPFRLRRSLPRSELVARQVPYAPPQGFRFLHNLGLQRELQSLSG